MSPKLKSTLAGIAFIWLISAPTFAIINSDPIDSVEAEQMANRILDSSLIFGIFESPGNTPIRHLKNGIIPEEQDQYLEIMIKNSVMKMNTIRGDFNVLDSDIFIPMSSANVESEEQMQFIPNPETRWLLFLKTVYDPNGSAMTDWALQVKHAGAEKYLNTGTVFEIYDQYHGNACVLWNKQYPDIDQIPKVSDDLYSDLVEIRKTLLLLPVGNSDGAAAKRVELLSDMIQHLKDPFGKAVGVFVMRKKM